MESASCTSGAVAAHRVITVPDGGAFRSSSDVLKWRPNSYDVALAMSNADGAPTELYILAGDITHASLPAPVSANGADKHLNAYAWSEAGQYLAYTITDDANDTTELATIDAHNSNALNIVSHAGAPRLERPSFAWASDNRLLYGFADGVYVASAGQSNSASKISGELDVDMGTNFSSAYAGTNPHNTEPAEQRPAFLAYREGTDVVSAFTVLLDGSHRIDAVGDMIDEGDVITMRFATDEAPDPI